MEKLDPIGIGLLNKLIAPSKDEVRYVLSSSWRHHYSKEEMEDKLSSEGWTGKFLEDDWRTNNRKLKLSEITQGELSRGRQIKSHLEDHPEVKNFVIFDDYLFDFEERGLKDHLVQTNFDDGISFSDFRYASEILYRDEVNIYKDIVILG